jgi:hypothetical protein
MEYAEKLSARQPRRTLVGSIVALAIGAAAASGIWALADDDGSSTAAGGTSTPTAVTDDPGSQYGTAQYRLPDAQPAPDSESRAPYGAKYRYPHP